MRPLHMARSLPSCSTSPCCGSQCPSCVGRPTANRLSPGASAGRCTRTSTVAMTMAVGCLAEGPASVPCCSLLVVGAGWVCAAACRRLTREGGLQASVLVRRVLAILDARLLRQHCRKQSGNQLLAAERSHAVGTTHQPPRCPRPCETCKKYRKVCVQASKA